MASSSSSDRLQQLESIEQQIATALQYAGQALSDVSKDKVAARQVESNTTQFTKTLESVESGLLKQINYLTTVSTGQPHEGSCYAAQKDMQMAFHRQEHVKSRLAELDRLRVEHLHQQPQQQQRVDVKPFGLTDASSS